MSSRFLVRGETATLELTVSESNREPPDRQPLVPAIEGVIVKPLMAGRPEIRMLERRQLAYVFKYSVKSFDIGRHRIPGLPVTVAGHEFRTRPVEFDVFPSDQLSWIPVASNGKTDRCAAAFRAVDEEPFENETTPVELKLYLPSAIANTIGDWGIPDFERDGVAVWRFEPSRLKSEVILNGRSYIGVSYPSNLTPTRSGTTTLGPGRLRLMKEVTIFDAFGPRREAEPLWLDVAATDLQVRPLPPGAPEGFRNAVGSFTLFSTSEVEEIREGDPVVVNLMVTGKGNLDSLAPPEVLDAPGWKTYEATAMPRGPERRDLEGTILFRQFLRPLDVQTQIPSFRLVYFDPDLEKYDSVVSPPIPLRVLPSTLAPPAAANPPVEASMPVEHMTDILGAIPGRPAGGWTAIPWNIALHMVASLLAATMLFRIGWRWLRPRLRRDPTAIARRRDYQQLEQLPDGSRDFYRGVGVFIERWLGSRVGDDNELAAVISDRDLRCFDPAAADSPLPKPERRKILRTLRRYLTVFLVSCPFILLGGPSQAASTGAEDDPAAAYEAGRYVDAAQLWLSEAPYDQLSASQLYNIGNCWYRLGSAGQAALYYRRALLRQPGHPEALQNLRFLERKFGSLSVRRPDYQYVLARLPKAFWSGLVWAGAWMLALGLLCFPSTRHGSRIRVAAVIGLVAAPVAAGVGGLGWRYYPDDASFAAPESQAVVIVDDAVVFTDASRTSPEVIDAPPGSLCQVIAERGEWTYVAFATRTRGWVPGEHIKHLIPVDPPQPPAATRPRSTDGST